MEKELFHKSAWIHIQDEKILAVRSKGNTVFFLPGGNIEKGEAGEQALIREIKEELSVGIIKSTIIHIGTFEATSYEFPEIVSIRMDCYLADYKGILKPSSEIEEIAWFRHKDKNRMSSVDTKVFEYLKAEKILT